MLLKPSTIKDVMEVETEAKVDEPFEEYELEVKPFNSVSDEVKKEINVDVIVYQLLKWVHLQ